jgi:TfoX/Sxy family transcriptional regulator of competence genes
MSYDEKTADRVRRILSRRTDVAERKMFGGLCFMVNGGMCCGLTSTALMVRVGPDRYDEALGQPHARPMDFTGRPLAGMVYVDPRGYRTDSALAGWVQRGVDFVSTLPSKSARRKPRRGWRDRGPRGPVPAGANARARPRRRT